MFVRLECTLMFSFQVVGPALRSKSKIGGGGGSSGGDHSNSGSSLVQQLYSFALVADSLQADASPISEVLNMAWAAHEITDEYLSEVRLYRMLLLILLVAAIASLIWHNRNCYHCLIL